MSEIPPLTPSKVAGYVATLAACVGNAQATGPGGTQMQLSAGLDWAMRRMRKAHADGNKLIFIGNGGSAGIASHVAIDYSKNGGMRSQAFNDASALTCLGNDFGYEHVFAKQIEFHGRAGDLLIAISSSGRSANILNAVAQARKSGIDVLTLSGFKPDNPLRQTGDVNLFVDSGEYGFVEIGHLALIHCILDLAMGWSPAA